MHNYKKLVVAGCSVSDRGGGVDWCYGDKLAELLDAEYDHQGVIIGSNDRIFRVVTYRVIERHIDSSTLVVIQYSNPLRREFWTCNEPDAGRPHRRPIPLEEPYDDGWLIRYKPNAARWQVNKHNKKFFELYETQFSNQRFVYENFRAQHYAFMHMLVAHHIPHVFLNAWEYFDRRQLTFTPTSLVINITKDNFPEELQQKPGDFHFSNEGHIEIANRIYSALQ